LLIHAVKKIHLALSTDRIDDSIRDYSKRLGIKPSVVVANEYALWRTDAVNLSIRQDSSCRSGHLRHLGWEDSQAVQFSAETDTNGLIWECFTAQQQAEKINTLWPQADYQPS